ncbi:MAG: helix-turn-helix domain-containing protein [Myxococcota bacterium]
MSRSEYEAILRGSTRFVPERWSSWDPWFAPALAFADFIDLAVYRELGVEHEQASILSWTTRCRAAFVLGRECDPLRRELERLRETTKPEDQGALRIGTAWLDAAEGRLRPLKGDEDTEFRRWRSAEGSVDLRLLQAVFSLVIQTPDGVSPSKLDAAVKDARRAAQRARSEELIDREFIAGLLLARARRLEQRSYLARHLLTTVPFPRSWNAWVEGELSFAGQFVEDPTSDFASCINDLYDQKSHPETSRIPQRFSAECAILHALLGRMDHDGFSPNGYPRLGVRDARVKRPRWDLVLNPDGNWFRRFASGRAGTEAHVDQKRSSLRSSMGLSRLVFAGFQGCTLATWFHRTFGYRYQDERHGNLRRVTLHRMRKALPECAKIEHDGDRIALHTHRTLIVPDPAAQPSLDERVLETVATGTSTASAIATQLRTPLRTIQDALKRLSDAGVTKARHEGRNKHYRVEDSSFFELTAARFARVRGDEALTPH